ncbi:hypothetical protein A1O3_02929 [Capronia epimyces CBS 606.96]|uniref:Histidine kinase n=1 Tax=Capronia epimyces CBS 606.96 TaxID=1182542 RepID=W9YAL3_9EURO|nr:uncharacterized protein A1O3_02929 [Capronia epimyces CBS 606.96]EXJ89862.1 hypothetical protein A1O3_02929 [Capronia epimyces CBS 606.96]
MASETMTDQLQAQLPLRRLEPHWNYTLIAASVAVSLLGAFTSTQMMCQARTARYFSGVLVWTILGSLTFGFCSIWSLHFIATLACELDVRVGLDVPLTILSAVLAVSFTFAALSSDLLRNRYMRLVRKSKHNARRESRREAVGAQTLPFHDDDPSTDALLDSHASEIAEEDGPPGKPNELRHGDTRGDGLLVRQGRGRGISLGPLEEHFGAVDGAIVRLESGTPQSFSLSRSPNPGGRKPLGTHSDVLMHEDSFRDSDSLPRSFTDEIPSRRSSATLGSDGSGSVSLPAFLNFRVPKTSTYSTTEAMTGIVGLIYRGATFRNFSTGFVWSLAITTMHYVGVFALKIPQGYITLRPFIVLLSASISWLVCTLGSILIPQIEVNLTQQLAFSVVASAGVAAKHFTGIYATTFWSRASPSEDHGYPPNLAVAVSCIAIVTCIFANGLLAHSATVARNKLAEIVQTKRKLWAAIAQKQNAEAAAHARSEFIASASHEIRTPLHQLQGYSDLLSRVRLSDEARLLLLAIQQATRSLSMITANVLDWSRLEKGEAICRPTNIDFRQVCESILTILPNTDEEAGTELMIAVAPEVSKSLFLDETYLQRVLMNLLTNALKFTQSGYVLLLVEMKDQALKITVKDSGFGIPESFLPHLFEPFKQAQTRGAERGTGLGLAIIRQLLDKMEGTIEVESQCRQTDEVGLEKCGSTFTVNIPISAPSGPPQSLSSLGPKRQIAFYGAPDGRFFEGLHLAWQAFGFELIRADPDSDMSDSWGFIWTDIMFLQAHPLVTQRLLQLRNPPVLVSYDSQLVLDRTIGSIPPAHMIPIRRPFVWHRMVDTISSAIQLGRASVDRSVRFAPVVDVVDIRNGRTSGEDDILRGETILLVEDNKINQKLGVKMLKTLGYNVIVADDGQEAIEKIIEMDQDIDLVLMDQSMPHKDGITATKEIREMELQGRLSRKRPIIMVTAVVGPDAQALCMSAGADAFLPKPLALSKLEHTLKAFFGHGYAYAQSTSR